MSWLFASGGQSIGASASASVLPMNTTIYKTNKQKTSRGQIIKDVNVRLIFIGRTDADAEAPIL